MLQGAVAELLTLAHGSPAIGQGPLDPELITACWWLNIGCRRNEALPHLYRQADAKLAQVRGILGQPLPGHPPCYNLTDLCRRQLVNLILTAELAGAQHV